MMANHTNINELFTKIVKNYELMRLKNVFLDQYKKERMFADNLEEFDDSK